MFNQFKREQERENEKEKTERQRSDTSGRSPCLLQILDTAFTPAHLSQLSLTHEPH